MNLKFEIYEHLIKEIRDIREEVFVFEQGFKEEFNEDDDKSIHVLCYVDEIPIGTSRIIYSKKHQSYSIGRVAVKKEYRKMGIGRLLMKRTEEEIVSRFGGEKAFTQLQNNDKIKNEYCNLNNIHLIRIPYERGSLDITEQRLKEIFIKEGILSYE